MKYLDGSIWLPLTYMYTFLQQVCYAVSHPAVCDQASCLFIWSSYLIATVQRLYLKGRTEVLPYFVGFVK